MIEINLLNLLKNERGTHEGYVTVHRNGKIFQRKQRLGQKEKNKNEKLFAKKEYQEYYDSLDFSDELDKYSDEFKKMGIDWDWSNLIRTWDDIKLKNGKLYVPLEITEGAVKFKNMFDDITFYAGNIKNNSVKESVEKFFDNPQFIDSVKLQMAINELTGKDLDTHLPNDDVIGHILGHFPDKEFKENLKEKTLDKNYLQKVIALKKFTDQVIDRMFPDTNKIKLYRGIRENRAENIKEELNKNGKCKVELASLSSWSERFKIAKAFSRGTGIIIKHSFLKKDIWLFWGISDIFSEREFTISSNPITIYKDDVSFGDEL